jgi:hypothetical protein
MKILKVLVVVSFLINLTGCLSNSNSDSGGSSTPQTDGLQWTRAPSNGLQNSCLGPFTVALNDGNGNIINAPSVWPVSLGASSNDVSIYSDSGCSNQLSGLTILANSSAASFYLKDDLNESFTLTANNGSVTVTTTVSTTAESSTLDYLVSTNSTGAAGNCSGPITYSLNNVAGTAVTAPADVNVSLTTADSTVQFFSDSGCNNFTSSVTIDQGSNSFAVYYIGGNVSTFSVQATSQMGSASSSIVMSSGTAVNLLASGNSGLAGSCLPVTITYTDVYNNVTALSDPMPVSLYLGTSSGTNFGAYSDSNCTAAISSETMDGSNTGIYSMNFPIGQSFTFYVTDSVTDSMDIEIVPDSFYVDGAEIEVDFQ